MLYFAVMSYRMLSGAQNTFVYRHMQNGTLDVKDNIQVLHLTPVSHVFQAGQKKTLNICSIIGNRGDG